jgi:hypothetical protein
MTDKQRSSRMRQPHVITVDWTGAFADSESGVTSFDVCVETSPPMTECDLDSWVSVPATVTAWSTAVPDRVLWAAWSANNASALNDSAPAIAARVRATNGASLTSLSATSPTLRVVTALPEAVAGSTPSMTCGSCLQAQGTAVPKLLAPPVPLVVLTLGWSDVFTSAYATLTTNSSQVRLLLLLLLPSLLAAVYVFAPPRRWVRSLWLLCCV